MNDSINKKGLNDVLKSLHFNPQNLIECLKVDTNLHEYFKADVGIFQFCSLEKHTLTVLQAYKRFYSDVAFPSQVSHSLFRLSLALHDIGKPNAILAGDKRKQHIHTVGIIEKLHCFLPINDWEKSFMISLLNGDPVGGFLKGELDLGVASDQIIDMAQKSTIPIEHFYQVLITYYQCDVLAYTQFADIIDVLDHLFSWNDRLPEWDSDRCRIKFVGDTKNMIDDLEANIYEKTK